MKNWPIYLFIFCGLGAWYFVSKTPQDKSSKTSMGAFSPPPQKQKTFLGKRIPTSQKALGKGKKQAKSFADKVNHRIVSKERYPKENRPARNPSAKNYFSGNSKFQFKGTEYLVSDHLAAVPSGDYRESMGEKIFGNYGYSFYRSPKNDTGFPYHDKIRPVILNTSTGQIGLMTGNILLQSETTPPSNNQMVLVTSQPQLDLHTVRPMGTGDIFALYRQLKASGEYRAVELEIIQGGAHVK